MIDSLFAFPGYPALFFLSFLAATVLPLGSEWLLVLMVIEGFSPVSCVLVATAGNYFGACTTYWMGRWGSEYVPRRILRMGDRQVEQATLRYQKYGSWSLLLSWVPIVGDPLCFVAGIFRVHFALFSVLVFCGKFARYSLLACVGFFGSH